MTKATFIRLTVLVIALVNQVLVSAGQQVIPWSTEEIESIVSAVFTAVAAAWAAWKNNSVTSEAIAADTILHDLKDGEYTEDRILESAEKLKAYPATGHK